MPANQLRIVAAVLFVLGVLGLIVAILYFALPAHSLPSFLPGHVAKITGHRNRRGAAALVIAILLIAVGAWATNTAKHAPR
jgi:H+/Cl- antiporter ClcA